MKRVNTCQDLPIILEESERPAKKCLANQHDAPSSIQKDHSRFQETESFDADEAAENRNLHQVDMCQSTSARIIPASHTPEESVGASGGLITSRHPSPVKLLHSLFTVRPNRVRIQDDRPTTYPEFAGAPTWSKPLMYAEFQVCPPQSPPTFCVSYPMGDLGFVFRTGPVKALESGPVR
jgi:hypothetical protein